MCIRDSLKCRLINVRSIECESRNGGFINIRESSSGEIALFSAILGIGSVLENSSPVFLDEPDLSLHPEWQKSYISLLQSSLREFVGHHIIVATHSPLIVSSSKAANTEIISLDDSTFAKNDSLYGSSSCLLYTSPSPRDKRQSRMPSSA